MYNSCDDAEDHYYAGLDADMEMAEMERVAEERMHDFAAGNCWHDSGFGYRETAFYPEQIGLSPGQMYCCDCQKAVATPDMDCFVCDLPPLSCMGARGLRDDHTEFVTPPMVAVCNVTQA